MTESHCDIILLSACVLCGFLVLSDMQARGNSDETDGQISTIFKGTFSAQRGDDTMGGLMRIQLASKETGMKAVRNAGLLFHVESDQKSQEMVMTGLQFEDSRQFVFQGATDPLRFSLFPGEEKRCHLGGFVDLSEGKVGKRAAVGELHARNCNWKVTFNANEIDVRHIGSKVLHYSILCDLLAMIQIRVFLVQMQHTDVNNMAAKVSLATIGAMALADAYESFLHLSLGMTTQYMFNTFAVIALFKFLLFSLLEARYVLAIWKARRQDAFSQGWETISRELSWLYSRFYGIVMIGLVLIYNLLPILHWVVFVFQFYWIPQICLDIYKGQRNTLHPLFIIGMSVSRLLLPLYLWGCPKSLFTGDVYPQLPAAPSYLMISLFVSAQLLQVGLLFTQRWLGARWFVPWVCLPHVYNYYRTIEIDMEYGKPECVICMCELSPSASRQVVTPCDHCFHSKCLEQWMDVKMECPTCRAELPVMS